MSPCVEKITTTLQHRTLHYFETILIHNNVGLFTQLTTAMYEQYNEGKTYHTYVDLHILNIRPIPQGTIAIHYFFNIHDFLLFFFI